MGNFLFLVKVSPAIQNVSHPFKEPPVGKFFMGRCPKPHQGGHPLGTRFACGVINQNENLIFLKEM